MERVYHHKPHYPLYNQLEISCLGICLFAADYKINIC